MQGPNEESGNRTIFRQTELTRTTTNDTEEKRKTEGRRRAEGLRFIGCRVAEFNSQWPHGSAVAAPLHSLIGTCPQRGGGGGAATLSGVGRSVVPLETITILCLNATVT